MRRRATRTALLIILLTMTLSSSGVNRSGHDEPAGWPYAAADAAPVIFLPGALSSALSAEQPAGCDQRPSGRIWLRWSTLLNPLRKDDLLATLTLTADGRQAAAAPCDRISADALVGTTLPTHLVYDQYGPLLDTLAAAGYQVAVFPYDWRLDLEQTADAFERWLNLRYGQDTPVTLIGHSMGGLLARVYLAQPARAARVARVVTIATPYLGSPKSTYALLTGEIVLPGSALWPLLNSYRTDLDQVVSHAPGLITLLPSRIGYNAAPSLVVNDVPVTEFETAQTVLTALGESPILLAAAAQFHLRYDDLSRNMAYTGPYTILAARHRDTVSRLHVRTTGAGRYQVEHGAYTDGDGAVPAASALLRAEHGRLRGRAELCAYEAGSLAQDHDRLMRSPRIQYDLLVILSGNDPIGCTPINE